MQVTSDNPKQPTEQLLELTKGSSEVEGTHPHAEVDQQMVTTNIIKRTIKKNLTKTTQIIASEVPLPHQNKVLKKH